MSDSSSVQYSCSPSRSLQRGCHHDLSCSEHSSSPCSLMPAQIQRPLARLQYHIPLRKREHLLVIDTAPADRSFPAAATPFLPGYLESPASAAAGCGVILSNLRGIAMPPLAPSSASRAHRNAHEERTRRSVRLWSLPCLTDSPALVPRAPCIPAQGPRSLGCSHSSIPSVTRTHTL